MSEPQGDASPASARTQFELRQEVDRLQIELAEARRECEAGRTREVALEGELLHRVRNMLAVIRSIFSRTIENAESLEHVADHFRGRLETLAQYQLRTGSYGTYYLEDMVRDTLLAFAVREDSRIEIDGPESGLTGRHAVAIGLALHELATNSVKFGVLAPSQGRGRLRLRWTVAGNVLSFAWLETGIAVVTSAPLRTGFGREYIEQALPYQFGAETSFELAAGSLHCLIAIPLSDRENNAKEQRIGITGVNDE